MPDVVSNLWIRGTLVVRTAIPEFREKYRKRDSTEGVTLLNIDIFGIQKLLNLLNFRNFLAAQSHAVTSLFAKGIPHISLIVIVCLRRWLFNGIPRNILTADANVQPIGWGTVTIRITKSEAATGKWE